MAEQYLGEIRIFPFNFAPRGWQQCDGTVLPITQNQALFSLLGTTYGGDGRTTFALPDLRGRVPIHAQTTGSPSYTVGMTVGSEGVALTMASMPSHSHQLNASNAGASTNLVANNVWANTGSVNVYASNRSATMGNGLATSGAGAVHENRQPSTVLNYCICVQGYYPPHP